MRGLTVCATGSTFRLGKRLYLNQNQNQNQKQKQKQKHDA